MLTTNFQRSNVTAALKRYDRRADLNRQLYIKTLRDIFPESRYDGTDELDIYLRDTLINSIEQFANVLAGIVSIEGLSFGLPSPRDKAALETAYNYFMSEEGGELFNALAVEIAKLIAPLAPPEQSPQGTLTEAQKQDPNSDSGGQTSPLMYAAASEKPQ